MTPSEIASGAVGRIQRRTEVVVVMEHTYFIKDFLFEWTCAHCGISRRKTQPQSGFSQIRETSDIFMATGVLSPATFWESTRRIQKQAETNLDQMHRAYLAMRKPDLLSSTPEPLASKGETYEF